MKKTALVTGASGGIGLELARVLAREGHDLWLVARSAPKLEALRKELSAAYPVSVQVLVRDLAEPSCAGEVFEELRKKGVSVDVLVNNAGIGFFGAFAETPLSEHERLINLNILSLTQLTRLFLGPMLEKKSGKILNVASTAAFQPGPLLAAYYASKAYVLHLSEALAEELRGSGVTVTTLYPGPTATDFQERARMGGSKLFKRAVMDAKTVAEAGYRGLSSGKTLVIPGFSNKLLALSSRFAPRFLVPRVVRMIQEKDKKG